MNLIDFILEAMGIDNEGEDICIENCNEETLDLIISQGARFYSYNTRWQIADIIGNRKNKGWKQSIFQLLNDKDSYVQRKVLIAISKIDYELAIAESFKCLKHDDNMVRIVALRIIKEKAPERTMEALNILEEDEDYIEEI